MMHELKAIYIIWLRELIRYWRNKIRIVASLAFPLLWLVVMGTGLSSSLRFGPAGSEAGDFTYVNFIFPGILAMTLMFTSMFGSLSIVHDREFGFFKEIFVAPISRASIVFGKILGGATIATIQASLIFLLAPFVGIPLSLTTALILLPAMFLIAVGLSSMGVVMASRIKSTETFPIVWQFVMMPMFFLSGALFPLRSVPQWLSALARLDPLTYGVNLLREIYFLGIAIPEGSFQALDITLFGLALTVFANLAIVFLFAAFLISFSVFAYRRIE